MKNHLQSSSDTSVCLSIGHGASRRSQVASICWHCGQQRNQSRGKATAWPAKQCAGISPGIQSACRTILLEYFLFSLEQIQRCKQHAASSGRSQASQVAPLSSKGWMPYAADATGTATANWSCPPLKCGPTTRTGTGNNDWDSNR
jgi:hypothetical protein